MTILAASPDAPSTIIDYIQSGGILGLLVFIIISGLKKMWVWGWMYRDAVTEVRYWRDLALRSANIAESLNELAKQKVGP